MHIARDADPALLPHLAAGGVRFVFNGPATLRSVALAGTFNSWVGDACMLERVTPTRWTCTLPLPPGRHLYRFVLDDTDWIADPANPWMSEDGQGNSCLTVCRDGTVFLRRRGLRAEAPGGLHRNHQALQSPTWLRDAVVYQLSVRAFGGDFDGVRARLGHLADLGVNTIWMMPIHPVGVAGRRGTLGDPYAVRDFEAIDPALGDEDGLRRLVDAIHARGMRIVFDWTLNRSSVDHPLTVTHPEWYQRDRAGNVTYAVPRREYFAGFDFRNGALRRYLIDTMCRWVERFGLDGMRFDDSDITPTDFLDEIRAALAVVKPDIALISQAYDEFHHLAACDLTYEGGTREMLRRVTHGEAGAREFAQYWNESTYSFPRDALRLRWLEEKEQPRADAVFGHEAHLAAAAVLLTMDGVPHILMGQEFGESGWRDWTVLFDDWRLDWSRFDHATFAHFSALLELRRHHPALRRGATVFIDGLPDGVIGMVRSVDGERIAVYANLASRPAALPARLLDETDVPLYARGWDQDAGSLDAHGCLVAPLR
jgi:glycosidase